MPFDHLRRREFITLLCGAAAWPRVAHAQERGKLPIIGFLNAQAAPDSKDTRLAAFRQGLKEAGYVEGRNVAFEYRWANNQEERVPGVR